MKKLKLYAGGTGAMLVAGAASAQDTIDTTAVTSAITAAGAAVAVIGAAVLVVLIGIKVWKWLARAA